MSIISSLPHLFAAGGCHPDGGGFFGLPHWYKYLSGIQTTASGPNGDVTVCNPQIVAIGDVWLVVAAVVEILVRVAALLAVIYVIWGGVQYIMSRGEPDKISKSKHTILDGITGLVIAVAATGLINFIATRF